MNRSRKTHHKPYLNFLLFPGVRPHTIKHIGKRARCYRHAIYYNHDRYSTICTVAIFLNQPLWPTHQTVIDDTQDIRANGRTSNIFTPGTWSHDTRSHQRQYHRYGGCRAFYHSALDRDCHGWPASHVGMDCRCSSFSL